MVAGINYIAAEAKALRSEGASALVSGHKHAYADNNACVHISKHA